MDEPAGPENLTRGVVVGCRREDGRWLLIRRGRGVRLSPLKVCFPGGTVEPGEELEAAAAREYREELGVEVTLVRRVWRCEVWQKKLTLWGWLGELSSFDLSPCAFEVEEPLWLTPDEAATHPDGLPRTDEFVAALEAAVRGRD